MKTSILTAFCILSVLQTVTLATTGSTGTSTMITTTYPTYTTTARAPSTTRPTSGPTYSTTNWYQLSSRSTTNGWETMRPTNVETFTTTYPTTQRYETTVPTPWPTRRSTETTASPYRTTPPTDRTNYGTQSTHWWYETTTIPPRPSSPMSTREQTTHDYVPETTGTPGYTSRWYTTTMGRTTTAPFPAQTFDKIIAVQSFKNLKIRQARSVLLRTTTNFNDHQVKVMCATNSVDFLIVESQDDTLSITSPSNCNLEIQSYQFERLDIGAVENVLTEDNLNGSRLSIVTGGQSTVYLSSIHYDNVDVMLFGGSSVSLTGSTRVLDVTQLGTGFFENSRLISESVQVFSRNSGLIFVKSTNTLSLFTSQLAHVFWCSPQIDMKTDVSNPSNPGNILQQCV